MNFEGVKKGVGSGGQQDICNKSKVKSLLPSFPHLTEMPAFPYQAPKNLLDSHWPMKRHKNHTVGRKNLLD